MKFVDDDDDDDDILTLLATLVFTALHAMQTRSCDEISVRLSVCPSVYLSVKRVHCDKTEESYFYLFI